MPDAPPPLPPRIPPVLSPAPVPASRSRPPASPVKRFFIGLGVSIALAVLGVVPLLGLPGVLPLGLADAILHGVRGTNPLARFGDSAWAAAIVVTLLAPVPIAPVLGLVTWRRPSLHAGLAWLLAFAVAAFWSLGVAFIVLLAS